MQATQRARRALSEAEHADDPRAWRERDSARARAHKVARLVSELRIVQLERDEVLSPEQLARALESMTGAWWAQLARRAGVPVPSDATRALVIAEARLGAASWPARVAS